MFIGIAGGAFNQAREMEMTAGSSFNIGPYHLVCESMTQDSKPEYDTSYAILDVYRGGKYVTQLAPEKRAYFAGSDHEQSSTIVALHSTAQADLYTVFEGINPDSGLPIIKAYLNPLIAWIWIGVVLVVIGTFIALAPNLVRSAVRQRQEDLAPTGPPAPSLGPAVAAVLPPCVNFYPGFRGPIFWAKAVQSALLCVIVVAMLGAGQSRYDRVGHELMCSCTCGQVLLECNHVGCPDSSRMINELHDPATPATMTPLFSTGSSLSMGRLFSPPPIRGASITPPGSSPSASFCSPPAAPFSWCGCGSAAPCRLPWRIRPLPESPPFLPRTTPCASASAAKRSTDPCPPACSPASSSPSHSSPSSSGRSAIRSSRPTRPGLTISASARTPSTKTSATSTSSISPANS